MPTRGLGASGGRIYDPFSRSRGGTLFLRNPFGLDQQQTTEYTPYGQAASADRSGYTDTQFPYSPSFGRSPDELRRIEAQQEAARRADLRRRSTFRGLEAGIEDEGNVNPQQELRQAIKLSDRQRQVIADRARLQAHNVYNPEIKAARADLRATKQERVRALDYADNAFADASRQVRNIARSGYRDDRRAIRQANQDARANRGTAAGSDSRYAARVAKSSRRQDKSFTRQMTQAIGAESAIAKNALNADFADAIRTRRSAVKQLRGQRDSKMAELRMQMAQEARDRNLKIYQETQGSNAKKTKAAAMDLYNTQYPVLVDMFNGKRQAAKHLMEIADASGVPRKTMLDVLKQNRKSKYEQALLNQTRLESKSNRIQERRKLRKENLDLKSKEWDVVEKERKMDEEKVAIGAMSEEAYKKKWSGKRG